MQKLLKLYNELKRERDWIASESSRKHDVIDQNANDIKSIQNTMDVIERFIDHENGEVLETDVKVLQTTVFYLKRCIVEALDKKLEVKGTRTTNSKIVLPPNWDVDGQLKWSENTPFQQSQG